jgi:hypothetical protein
VRRGWSVRVLGVALVAVAIVTPGTASSLTTPKPLLVVEDLTHGRVLYRARVAAGGVLALSYVHSSEHVPVRGTFIVEAGGALVAKETAFAGFGPGLPEPRAGDAWRFESGMIVVPAAGERFPELRVRVAPFTRHRLRAPSGQDVDLSALTGAGGLVRIYAAR